MHILLVTTYFEPDSGAAAVRLSRLAHMLHDRGHTITVLTSLPHYPQGRITDGYRGAFSRMEDCDGLRVIRTWLVATPSPRISRKLISQFSYMLTAFLRGLGLHRPDVVLIEAQPVFTNLAGVALSRIKRVPYVLNVSDLWPDHLLSVGALTETHPVYRIARKLVDTTYRRAAAIVAMSPAWAEAIEGYIGQRDKIQVIYNGVDLDRFRPGLDTAPFRAEHDLTAKHLVTFIGTFATQYDFDAMFNAIGQLVDRDDVQFVFIGDGSQSDKVAGCQLPNVRHLRWITHDQVPLAWAASTLTFWAMRDQPLYAGTIPAKLYEALASGVPVVAAMRGEGARMLDASGGGVVAGDDLAAIISAILDDSERRTQLSAAGRLYAETHFAPAQVTRSYEMVLDSVR